MAKTDKLRVPLLERSPSHLLHGALQLALDIYSEELGSGAVTQRQFAVLSAVAEQEGLTQTDLVRSTGIDRSTLADMIARMIAKGFLARERSAADARANTVRLTEQGRAALVEAGPRVAAADTRILAVLSPGKRDGFVNQLHNLAYSGVETPGDEPASKTDVKGERKKKTKADAKHGKVKGDKKGKKKAKKPAAAAPEPTP